MITSDRSGRYLFLLVDSQWFCFDGCASPIGSGATGDVYLGWNFHTNDPVAVKMVRPEYSDVPEIRQMARTESGLRILHPNIMRNIGLCEYDSGIGPLFIISEYVNGCNFDVFCRDKLAHMSSSDKIRNVIDCSVKILEALQYVHDLGFVHRDVKPSNIMVSRDGVPKLMDLGIAKFEYIDSAPEQSFIGTSLYAAPELSTNDFVDYRADIYAMGVTIFELLSGYNPYVTRNQKEILYLQRTRVLPDDDFIPKELMSILHRATAKHKAERYPSAQEFAIELTSYLDRHVSDTDLLSPGRVHRFKNRWQD